MAKDPSRPPTMRDVAERAGVDRTLVSKVLNNDPRLKIPQHTRQRVEQAIEELDYRPNLVARGLRTTQTYMLGFQLPGLTNPVYAPIVSGAQRRAMEHGYVIAAMDISSSDGEPAPGRRLPQRVDGSLLASGTLSDSAVRGHVLPGTPTVVVNRRVDGVPWVLVDDEAGSALAARHLLDLGHTRLAIMTGPDGIDTSRRRRHGFESALGQGAGQAPVAVMHAAGWDGEAGYLAGCELLDREPQVTAVFAATTMLGIGLLRAAHECGRPVPDSLSIVTLHDSDWLNYTIPPLTAVALPMDALGAAAVDQLLALVRKESPDPTMITEPGPRLIVRGSSAPPAG